MSRYLSIKVEPQEGLLERKNLVELLFNLIGDRRWVVIHGPSGAGKSTLARDFFHTADQRDAFVHFAWVSFAVNLPKSVVIGLGSNWQPAGHVEKNQDFYDQVAREEIRNIRNLQGRTLLVLDGIPDEQTVLTCLDLLEIKNAVVLITTPRPFADSRFLNFTMPPLEDGDVLHFFAMAGRHTQIPDEPTIQMVRERPYLMRLLCLNTPKNTEKAAKNFVRLVLAEQAKAGTDASLADGIFRAKPLDAASCWLLMQFAALPEGKYDLEAISAYLLPEQYAYDPENEDADLPDPETLNLATLKGFQFFEREYGQQTGPTHLPQVVNTLCATGWLDDLGGEYAVHTTTAEVLRRSHLNQAHWYPELANCFSLNYFSKQHSKLKDNVFYELHLVSLLHFWGEQANEHSLALLSKLITFHHEILEYRTELRYRARYVQWAERCAAPAEIIRAKTGLAENHCRLSNYTVARDLLEPLLPQAGRFSEPLHAHVQNALGLVYYGLIDYARARDLLEAALASDLKNFGPGHSNVAALQSNLANVYANLGEYARARDLLEAALASNLKHFGPEHPTVARCQSDLATIYQDLGEYARSRDLLEVALASDLKNFGPEHPTVAGHQSNLASVYQNLGEYARARDLLEAALASNLKNFGSEHPDIARCQSNLASVYQNLGEYARARDLLEAALASNLKNFGSEHPDIARCQSNLATVYSDLGECARARDLLEAALASVVKNFGDEHPNVAHCQSNLATVYKDLGEYARARDLLEAALAAHLKNFGPEHPTVAPCQSNLAHVYAVEGNWVEALPLWQQAHANYLKNLGEQHPHTQLFKQFVEQAEQEVAGA